MDEKENFDFDAPRIRDFSSAKYQKKRKRIEMLLLGKEPKEKMVAAPRKTIFSEMFRDTPREVEEDSDESIDDMWFQQQEEAQEKGPSMEDVHVHFEPGLFKEEAEERSFLERLKIVETPKIKQVVREPQIDLTPIKRVDFGEITDSPRLGKGGGQM
jgi:hypothetical protein